MRQQWEIVVLKGNTLTFKCKIMFTTVIKAPKRLKFLEKSTLWLTVFQTIIDKKHRNSTKNGQRSSQSTINTDIQSYSPLGVSCS